MTIQFPTGYGNNVLTNVELLGSGTTKIADVLLTDSYSSFTALQRTAIVGFVQQGAGLVLGGQAWCVSPHTACASTRHVAVHSLSLLCRQPAL